MRSIYTAAFAHSSIRSLPWEIKQPRSAKKTEGANRDEPITRRERGD
jgi:hypothetical protein